MPQTLEAVRHDREQKTPDTLLGLQRHGVHAMTLAPMAVREAHAAVAHLQEAMMGHRDAMARASQAGEHLGWPSARALGVDHPRLVIELVEPVGKACGGAASGRHLHTAQRLFVVDLLEGREELGAEDRAQGPHRKRKRGWVGTQRGPSSAKAPAGTRQWRWTGLECLVPGRQDHGRAEWPPRFCWPHWRSVWLTVRNSSVSRRRLLSKRRGLRACGTVNTVWQEGVGSNAARGATPHWAVAHV